MPKQSMLNVLFYFLAFIFLTITTQIGGLVLLFSLFVSSKITREYRFKKTVFFFIIYLLTTFAIVPLIAPIFGREKVRHSDHLYPTTYATVLLNRNYVSPKLNDLLERASNKLGGSTIELRYLDANFPFIDGFPLLPHLSHSDGNKIDISFVYTEFGKSVDSRKKKSLSGYGVFEAPQINEMNQIDDCINRGYWQYDLSQYCTFGRINEELNFSNRLNIQMINVILKEQSLEKLFIEPHLKNRLRLKSNKVRFHGCQAVRHDDHIHVQL